MQVSVPILLKGSVPTRQFPWLSFHLLPESLRHGVGLVSPTTQPHGCFFSYNGWTLQGVLHCKHPVRDLIFRALVVSGGQVTPVMGVHTL